MTACVAILAFLQGFAQAGDPPAVAKLPRVGHPSLESPHVSPILALDGRVFVTNTPAGTIDVITPGRGVTRRIPVGIDPVSIACRPDGREIWVSNHVSDSVSVIDTDTSSASFLRVVATIQDLDHAKAVTRFDEPAGIAFADNTKAYVALSSSNQVAVVDVASRKVVRRLHIPAQEPRAIAVSNGRLFVLPFESGNQTQLSGGIGKKDDNLVTFDAYEHSIRVNNVLSIGHVTDIVRNPAVPDRDLFIFLTADDSLDREVNSLGTLLYGLAVDAQGNAFIAQTEARNDANGRAGSRKHGLLELGNRPFLNQVTVIPAGGDKPRTINRAARPPQNPEPAEARATPCGLQVLPDGFLAGSAAGSDTLFTL
ncbi:MAG: YncE family protein, partial [Gemmataceae bacterium]